jgi:hypothetical protein
VEETTYSKPSTSVVSATFGSSKGAQNDRGSKTKTTNTQTYHQTSLDQACNAYSSTFTFAESGVKITDDYPCASSEYQSSGPAPPVNARDRR